MAQDPTATDDAVLSIEEFERLPDDGWRLELVRGHVVREPPAGFEHCRLAGRIAGLLHAFDPEHGLGEILTADPGFVLFEERPTVRAPDVAFVAADRIPAEIPVGFARFAPDLAVEIVSPSNTLAEIHDKVLDYLDAGARLVWVVDPARRNVIVYRSRDEIRLIGEEGELDGGDVLPGFRVGVARIFRRSG